MPTNRTRYDKCIAQIKADLRQAHGRELSDTRLDQMLTVASDWFLSINPDRWPFATVQATSPISQTETVVIQSDTGTIGPVFWSSASPTEAGDIGSQMSVWTFAGYSLSNTNAGVLYWKLTASGGVYTVTVYKDSGGAAVNAVASGSRTGDGSITLTAQNSSGLTGSVTVAYTADNTTVSANTLTFDLLSEPKLSSLWIVKTQVGASTGNWKPLNYVPWMTINNRSKGNRTATTTANQTWWSIKNVGSVAAGKYNAITLETYPYSYAGTTDAQRLYYQVDYFRKTPAIAVGDNADDD